MFERAYALMGDKIYAIAFVYRGGITMVEASFDSLEHAEHWFFSRYPNRTLIYKDYPELIKG